MHVLLVCTANICRSPLAAAMLARGLADAGVAASVDSAGVLDAGRQPPDEILDELRARGFDEWLTHQSSSLTPERVRDAELIVCMAREHLREVVAVVPEARPYTFTLKDLVRRGGAGDAPRATGGLSTWLAALDATRTSADLLGSSAEDDVEDPFGRSRRAYRRTAAELDGLTAQLARLVADATAS